MFSDSHKCKMLIGGWAPKRGIPAWMLSYYLITHMSLNIKLYCIMLCSRNHFSYYNGVYLFQHHATDFKTNLLSQSPLVFPSIIHSFVLTSFPCLAFASLWEKLIHQLLEIPQNFRNVKYSFCKIVDCWENERTIRVFFPNQLLIIT